jgi:hypothetical protein
MQQEIYSSPPTGRPIAIEVDGEPLGVVVPSDEGYRFLAVRYVAFPLDGQIFESVEEARNTLGAAIHASNQD